MVIYGLANCDKTRAARKAHPGAGFVDVRAAGLPADLLSRVLATFGDRAVNRASTTWRQLPEADRALPLPELLLRHPTLLKRPLIDHGDRITQGWPLA